jgi:hypothetical protein
VQLHAQNGISHVWHDALTAVPFKQIRKIPNKPMATVRNPLFQTFTRSCKHSLAARQAAHACFIFAQ